MFDLTELRKMCVNEDYVDSDLVLKLVSEIERQRALIERAKLLLEPVRIAGNTFTKNICDENGKLIDSNVIWLKDAIE